MDSGAASSLPSAPTTAACKVLTCLNPTPMLVDGMDTGFDTCAAGGLRRRAAVECPSLLPRAIHCIGVGACTYDSDCPGGPLTYCKSSNSPDADGALVTVCTCTTGCLSDSDCQTGQICLCGEPEGTCVSSTCATPQVCANGCDCLSGSGETFQCQNPEDACLSSNQCAGRPVASASAPPGCAYSGVTCTNVETSTGAVGPTLGCQPTGLTCGTGVTGRPFLVRGRERHADPVSEGAWARPSLQPCRDAPREVLAAAATHWTRAGLMEHASIAAFARFTLHLLALGAPPDLIDESQRAMKDETEHARLAFALASAYAGEPVGPGPLAIDGALDAFDVRDFVTTLVREGCIGETLASIEALDALEAVCDPVVRQVVATIARDELRHAVLAWRVLEWVVASGRVRRAEVLAEVEGASKEVVTARCPAGVEGESHGVRDDALRAFGLLGEPRRAELRRQAVESVIGPRATAWLTVPAPRGGGKRPRAPHSFVCASR